MYRRLGAHDLAAGIDARLVQRPGAPESAIGGLDDLLGYPASWPDGAARLAALVSGGDVGGAGPIGDDDDTGVPVVTTAGRDTYIGILRCNENTVPTRPLARGARDIALAAGSSGDMVDTLSHLAAPCPFPATSIPPATRPDPLGVAPLVLASDHDPVTPAVLGRMTAEATGATLVRVAGVQHALFGYATPRVDEVVLHYLRTGRAAGGQHLAAARPPVPG